MEYEKRCELCGAKVKSEKDDCEPLIIHRCTNSNCKHIEFERINDYQG